jgi:hypothetical protein
MRRHFTLDYTGDNIYGSRIHFHTVYTAHHSARDVPKQRAGNSNKSAARSSTLIRAYAGERWARGVDINIGASTRCCHAARLCVEAPLTLGTGLRVMTGLTRNPPGTGVVVKTHTPSSIRPSVVGDAYYRWTGVMGGNRAANSSATRQRVCSHIHTINIARQPAGDEVRYFDLVVERGFG